jgi:hypothetical protein
MLCKPLLIFVLVSLSCNNAATHGENKLKPSNNPHENIRDKNPYQSVGAIPLPQGYSRMPADSHSFTHWLRNTALKQNNTVYLFDGRQKLNQSAQFAVLDISVGNKDLQQCADAVMRLRAEYLFSGKQYAAISFTDNENGKYVFTAPYTKEHFTTFMTTVFGYCGSASLSKQLKPVIDFAAIKPGDVLIRGGFPGHAVIVMDVAADTSGHTIFMLAQSYMPAQDIHILNNPIASHLSPWYEVTNDKDLITPEYLFYTKELKQW